MDLRDTIIKTIKTNTFNINLLKSSFLNSLDKDINLTVE